MHSPTLAVPSVDRSFEAALRRKIDAKTKPPGSLGRLEALALQIGLVRGSLSPTLNNPHIVVFAGDHGAAKAGISAFPQDVTWQMVENFLAGGAAINVFARANGIGLTVVDAGVNHDFGARPNLVDAKVGSGGTATAGTDASMGTANYLEGAAMSAAQRDAALAKGAEIVAKLAADGCEVIGFGEMGIGNTAAASLITHCLTGLALEDCIGRGTGLDDAGLVRKRELLTRALDIWPERPRIGRLLLAEGGGGRASPREGREGEEGEIALATLARYGGFEIVMMAGAMLAAARHRMLVLVDGFICGAAALAASRIAPAFLDYAVFCHVSAEAGHRKQLEAIGATPLMTLDMRLGEGTGAALAWPLVRAACAFLNEMASFESAGVSEKL